MTSAKNTNPPANPAPTTGSIPALTPRKLTVALLSMSIGGFGIGTVEFAMMGLLPNVAHGVNVSIPQAGYIISAYALGVVVGAPLITTLTARLPRKPVVMGLMALFTLANLSSYFANDFSTLMVTRFIAGLPHGAFFGLTAVVAASLVPITKRGRAIGLVSAGLPIANVVGVPFATFIGQQFGWRWLFVFVSIVGLAAFASILYALPKQPAPIGASIRGELKALSTLQVWLSVLIGVVGFGGFFAFYSYIAPTFTSVAGVPPGWLPFIVGLYGVGMVAGNTIGARLTDKSVLGTIYGALSAIAVALLVFSVAVHSPYTAIPMVLFIGASGTMLVPALQARLLDASPKAPSLASAMNQSALNIANALGAFLGSVVISLGLGFIAPSIVGAILAILGLGVAAISGIVERRSQRASAAATPSN